MLIKLNTNWFLSKSAIQEVYVEQGDNKAVRLVGNGFKFISVFDTDTEADACLNDVVSKLNNSDYDFSMYVWNTF